MIGKISRRGSVFQAEIFEIEETYKKAALIALATFAFSTAHFEASWQKAGGLSLFVSGSFLGFEEEMTPYRKPRVWLYLGVHSKEEWQQLMLDRFVEALVSTCILFFLVLSSKVRVGFSSNYSNFVFTNVALVPFMEEVLFRGLIQDGIEDLGILYSHHIAELNDKTPRRVSCRTQAILYGIWAMIRKRAFEDYYGSSYLGLLRVFITGVGVGLELGGCRGRDETLLPPFGIHATQNGGILLGFYCIDHLRRKLA